MKKLICLLYAIMNMSLFSSFAVADVNYGAYLN